MQISRPVTLHHKPLETVFESLLKVERKGKVESEETSTIESNLNILTSLFCPSNGCLSDKKDKALSLCLLAAFRALDHQRNKNYELLHSITVSQFRDFMIKELRDMGVKNPVGTVKMGGVGADTLDHVASKYYRNMLNKMMQLNVF